ncbi:MAG: T9SS type A sorting domain-containing protein [Calditrichaeota bacterium]|nr:T9SS type A sorting domain-containing protein [Calditrichota bacterium]MCB9366298.1 T9SS type A sorting domain-containing protein [Calditrichota bacterium]
MRYLLLASALFCGLTTGIVNAQDTLRVMTYNILNFSSSSGDRLDDLRVVLGFAEPDVLVLQEIIDGTAVNNILNQVLRPMDPEWNAATFVNGPDTDNACFYHSGRVMLESQRQIGTQLRDFTEYVFSNEVMVNETFRIFSAHLKASDGTDNEQRRLAECEVLRNVTNDLPTGSYFMMAGDFNLYSSFEPAYQHLLSLGTNPDGRFLDPINRPGAWHNSITFAEIHTQSPRTQSFGGGATGGMDDRFDFILASAAWMDTSGSYLIPSTYHVLGNDGLHFNMAVNDGTNASVPDSVADALHNTADHLPVLVDVVLRPASTSIGDPREIVQSHDLLECYPNPFNSVLTVELDDSPNRSDLYVFDVLGRQVMSVPVSASPTASVVKIDFASQTSGHYFVTLRRAGEISTQRVTLQR